MDSNTESKITENTSLVEKVFTFQNVYHAHQFQRKKHIILLEMKFSIAAARVKV